MRHRDTIGRIAATLVLAAVWPMAAVAGEGGDCDAKHARADQGGAVLAAAEDEEMAAAKSSEFIGTDWRLQKMTFDGAATALAPDTPVSIRFDDKGRVSGRAPVNRFSGAYRVSGDGTISWADPGFATTRMAGPPEEMEREDLFLQVLGQVTRYRLSGAQLILETTDSDTSLTFTK